MNTKQTMELIDEKIKHELEVLSCDIAFALHDANQLYYAADSKTAESFMKNIKTAENKGRNISAYLQVKNAISARAAVKDGVLSEKIKHPAVEDFGTLTAAELGTINFSSKSFFDNRLLLNWLTIAVNICTIIVLYLLYWQK